MIAQTSLLPTEPLTHVSQSHWRECLLCEDYTLTTQQLHKFYALKQQANILFEGPNQRWDLVKTLYAEYFEEESEVKIIKVSGKQWLRLGFQGQYPQTDFRGGGVLSLQLILRFVRNRKGMVRTMEQDKGNFFFAITAINICFFMKKYFHLAQFLVPGRDEDQYCNRRALKNFCRILAINQGFFHETHEKLLVYFYEQIWLKASNTELQMLLQFNSLFDRLKKILKTVFEQNMLLDQHDFDSSWRETAQRSS